MNQYPKYFPIAGAKPQRLAVVCAQWHADLVAQARDALLDELGQLGVPADALDRFEVPGAFEIPLLAQQLARSGRYAAIVACALVVDGGIYRHEFVAEAVIGGLMRVQLDTEVPVRRPYPRTISTSIRPIAPSSPRTCARRAPRPRAPVPTPWIRSRDSRSAPEAGRLCCARPQQRRPALPQEPQSAAPE